MASRKCPMCGHFFENNESLSRHLSRHHAAGLDRWTA